MTAQSTITRRSLLKTVGTASAGLAAFGALSGCSKQATTFTPDNLANTGSKDEVFGYCSQCMQCGNCNYVATMKDGVAINIEGDTVRATNAGTLCPRGKGAIMSLYNPHRITAPMKRTNPEKGMDVDPGWVEISWDEALDLAAEKIGAVVEEDPRKLVNFFGFSAYTAASAGLGLGVWAKALGTCNFVSTNGEMCDLHYGGCLVFDSFPTVNYDTALCEYVVVMGRTVGLEYADAGGGARNMAANLREGRTKYVYVAPRNSIESSRGEWVPARPGSDLALIYAWLNEMVNVMENGFDIDFVKARTNAPYLIGEDGNYVVNAEGKPYIWDAADDTAKAWDDPSLSDPALEGTFAVEGIPCTVAFQLFREALKDFTCEWAAPITDLPADRIRQIAHDLVSHARFGATTEIEGEQVPLRPAALIIGRGVTNLADGTLIDCYSRIVNVLLGNINMPGGIVCSAFNGYCLNDTLGVPDPYLEAMVCGGVNWPPQMIDLGDSLYPHRHCTATVALEVLTDPAKYGFDYEPSLIVSSGSNPVESSAAPEVAIEAFKKMDYVIYANCYHMNETAMLADLLLPEHAHMEGHTAYYYPGSECTPFDAAEGFNEQQRAAMVNKGVAPLYNTMDGSDIYIEILDRMGKVDLLNEICNTQGVLGWSDMFGVPYRPEPPAFIPPESHEFDLEMGRKHTMEEMYDMNLKAAFGADKGLDYLDDVRILPYRPFSEKDIYASLRHEKDQWRLPIYLESQKRSGDVLLAELNRIQAEQFDLEGAFDIDLAEWRRRYTALPYYPTERLYESEDAQFDLYAHNFRVPSFLYRMGNSDQDPIRRAYSEAMDPEFNGILINTATAQAKGIADGDRISVESPYGKTAGTARLTERIRPDSIGIPGGIGRHTKAMGEALAEDTNWNNLMSGRIGHRDPLGGGIYMTVRVKVSKIQF